jgi:intermediate peptidase
MRVSNWVISGGRTLPDGSYQLPIVAVICNFPPPSPSAPSLLTHGMVENLFHEMGHAMHSMLARTRYQHVTGTRCATDFAEVPSVLMEYFAWDPRVLSKFAKHFRTGQSLPEEMINKLSQSRNMFGALEMQRQVLYSMVDQVYHGKHPLTQSTTDIMTDLQKQYTVIPHVEG